MSPLYEQGQDNPEGVIDFGAEEFKKKVERTVQALETNKKVIHRWFWKLLLAFNLVLWSVALCIAALLSLP